MPIPIAVSKNALCAGDVDDMKNYNHDARYTSILTIELPSRYSI